MYMHVTTGDGTRQQPFIRKLPFVAQCRREAGLLGILTGQDRQLITKGREWSTKRTTPVPMLDECGPFRHG